MPGALDEPTGPLVPALPVEPVELPVEPVELPPIEPEPEVPGDVLPVDEGLVVEDEEPVEPEVPEASSVVLRLQPPSVNTADNATATTAADLRLLDAYISVPFKEWKRLTVSQPSI